MKQEIKICQNCKKDFIIEAEDFNFYEKIKVPPPTFCPECRFIRRLAWRNERVLYRRDCSLCKKNIISMYAEFVSFPVYCRECWHGDAWEATTFGRGYDFSRSFFEQFKELLETVPRLALWQRNSINSDYSNYVGESRNVYLSVSVVKGSENVFYSTTVDKSSDIIDCANMKEGQSLYENIEGEKNYNCQHVLLSRNCLDSYFLVDCVNCSNCLLSYNLRNKEFYIRNKQYSKEEYLKEIKKLNLQSRASREILIKEFEEIKQRAIYRFANIIRSVNSTGNNLSNVKNCKNCFNSEDVENVKYGYRTLVAKDCMDFTYSGWSEMMYEYVTGSLDDYNVKFSHSANNSVRDADYVDFCANCNDIFGCTGLKNKENAILNRVYSKEEFNKLREEIIKQMENVPFVDKVGRIYRYGEFFPVELSPWGYNETIAQEFFPITEEEAAKKGYTWRESIVKNFKISIPTEKIPDNIVEVNDEILKEVLGCAHAGRCDHHCNVAFRLTDYELKFYKKHNIPLPVLCSNCRHYKRFIQLPLPRLYKRECMCDKENHSNHKGKCEIEFETNYAPDRPETVYCERCYQQEIY
ncbi:MAG: hypothetical protein PHT16_03245 [Candidatus Pacebacteria bacterium]|nr:hypothetical protein [Candidatus Paceibacterota bacterium]